MPSNEALSEWDAIVVGAGVAGAMSALHLARAGLRVLLVEKATWPRAKACGGCLNLAAVRALANAGIELHEGSEYSSMQLSCRGRSAGVTLPRGVAISRTRLDAILVGHAIHAGARFVSGMRATLGALTQTGRGVVLSKPSTQEFVSARVVLDCGGLATRLLPDTGWQIHPRARIGVAATLPGPAAGFGAGIVHMACAAHGYVGLVRVENGATQIAAALDPGCCHEMGGPATAVSNVLRAAGLPPVENLHRLDWQGTPHLTRTRCQRWAEQRVLILGDAAGYVEPFTGEGMAWALADAAAVLPFVCEAAAGWKEDISARWYVRHRRMLRTRQRLCRGISGLLRHPRSLAAVLPMLDIAPILALPLTASLNRDFIATGKVAG